MECTLKAEYNLNSIVEGFENIFQGIYNHSQFQNFVYIVDIPENVDYNELDNLAYEIIKREAYKVWLRKMF